MKSLISVIVQLADNIKRLLGDDKLRTDIIEKNGEIMQQYDYATMAEKIVLL